MIIATTEQGIALAEPRSFTGLMTLYESNYIRLQRLTGDPRRLSRLQVSRTPCDEPLFLSVLGQTRYTFTLHLTYWFAANEEHVAEPDLTVKIYRDARLAEACSCGPHGRHTVLRGYPTNAAGELARRWARNLLLAKWLDFCLENGHSFRGAVHGVLAARPTAGAPR